MKLVYWYIPRHDDSDCYSIRARTKKDALAQLAAIKKNWGEHARELEFGPIEKVVMEYKDGFELMDECLSECQGSSLRID